MAKLALERADGLPFEPNSLTEDYELGLAVAAQGGQCRFVRARGDDDQLVATRAYFPSTLGEIVRQKTRWVHGVALQGWDRTGWSGGLAERWMRARDRRGPLTAMVLALGYIALLLALIISIGDAFGQSRPPVVSPLLMVLVVANFAFVAWRAAWRFAFTARNYGLAEGVFAIIRIPVTNVISIMAGHRAISAYWRSIFGKRVEWDKTSHRLHPAHPRSGHASPENKAPLYDRMSRKAVRRVRT